MCPICRARLERASASEKESISNRREKVWTLAMAGLLEIASLDQHDDGSWPESGGMGTDATDAATALEAMAAGSAPSGKAVQGVSDPTEETFLEVGPWHSHGDGSQLMIAFLAHVGCTCLKDLDEDRIYRIFGRPKADVLETFMSGHLGSEFYAIGMVLIAAAFPGTPY